MGCCTSTADSRPLTREISLSERKNRLQIAEDTLFFSVDELLTFEITVFNIKARNLPGTEDVWLLFDFGEFGEFKTESITGTSNPNWKSFSFSLQCHASLAKLTGSALKIECRDRGLMGERTIGDANINLSEIATGPVHVDHALYVGQEVAGRVAFNCKFEQVNEWKVDCTSFHFVINKEDKGAWEFQTKYTYTDKHLRTRHLSSVKSPRYTFAAATVGFHDDDLPTVKVNSDFKQLCQDGTLNIQLWRIPHSLNLAGNVLSQWKKQAAVVQEDVKDECDASDEGPVLVSECWIPRGGRLLPGDAVLVAECWIPLLKAWGHAKRNRKGLKQYDVEQDLWLRGAKYSPAVLSTLFLCLAPQYLLILI